MDSIIDLAPEIQKRISDFEYFLDKEGMKRTWGKVYRCDIKKRCLRNIMYI